MVRYLIDTSSLVSLVRYYQPFDTNGTLKEYIKLCFKSGDWILHVAVSEEIQYVQRKLVVANYPFLEKDNLKSGAIKTAPSIELITKKQHNKIDSHWAIQATKDKIISDSESDIDYTRLKASFIESADAQLILTALADKDNLTIITEESSVANDDKVFKKIPMICKMENISCINLPALLKQSPSAPKISFKPSTTSY